MSFDPSTNAAALAALVARCEWGQFTQTSVATQQIAAGHRLQPLFAVVVSQPRTALSWACRYRGRDRRGASLIVNNAQLQLGIAALLFEAAGTLDAIDLQDASFGANPNPNATR